jgi:hypothetical protein
MKKDNDALNMFKYLSSQPKDMQNLFKKVLNLHLGYQVDRKSHNEILGEIRKNIETIVKNKKEI